MKAGGARGARRSFSSGVAGTRRGVPRCTVVSVRVDLRRRGLRSVNSLHCSNTAFRGTSGARLFRFVGSIGCVYKRGVVRRSTGCLFASGAYR